MTSSPPPQPPAGGPPPDAPNPHGHHAAGAGSSMDLKKLTMADYVIAGGTVLFLILALFPWWEFGSDFFGISYSLSGFSSGMVSSAFVLFLLAAVWAALPAFYDLSLGFPRAWVTVGLAGLGFLLTLFAWIDTFNAGFSIWALLGTVVALAIALFAVLTLLPELRTRPALPGGRSGAAQWANQQAPDLGRQQGQSAAPDSPYAPPRQYAPPPPPPYTSPPQTTAPYAPSPYAPPPPTAAPPPAPPAGGPAATGGPSDPAEHPGSA